MEKKKRKFTDSEKENFSIKRKAWLAANPDKHPWRNKDKHQSVPCQKMKEFLISKNIQFVEEFQPEVGGRYFSIDIAMPDKLIALEINGNQHYEKNELLKPYYQERHDLLELNGWAVYEIHYSACFNLEKLEEFFIKLGSAENKIEFDYFNYKSKEKIEFLCEDCNCLISRNCKRCRSCRNLYFKKKKAIDSKAPKKINNIPPIKKARKSRNPKDFCGCGNKKVVCAKECMECSTEKRRKINWPAPTDLQKTLWEKTTVQIAKGLGVSDKAVEKYAKKHRLTKPPRGYWLKCVAPEGIEP